jgi:hypothetical protein
VSAVAQHVRVELVDDLDGSPAQETIEFGLDGTLYTIDLSSVNARQLRATFEPYVAGARRSAAAQRSAAEKSGKRRPEGPAARRQDDSTTERIRALTERVRQNRRSSESEEPEPNPAEPEETMIALPALVQAGEAGDPQPTATVLAPVFQPPQR